MAKIDETYLGDGAYAHHDGYAIWITTSDGVRSTNEICLEPEVLREFLAYVKRVVRKPKAGTT